MSALAPRGLRPVRMLDGSPWNGALTVMAIPASDGTATFIGDVVVFHTDAGAAALSSNGLDLTGVPQVVRASSGTVGQNIAGVVMGFLPDPTNLSLRYRLASTLRVALVCLADGIVFEAQEDGVTSNLAAADANLNVPFSTTAGNTATGVSKEALVGNSKAVTATLPLRLLGLSKVIGNTYGASSTDGAFWEFYFNTSQQKPNIVGVV
jgi:hypothetical protein